MKLYVIAGEASGDLHGANLMKALKAKDESIDFRFWGGDRMKAIAGSPVKHIKELAFMGFAEVFDEVFLILVEFDEFDVFLEELSEFFKVFCFAAYGNSKLSFFYDEDDTVVFYDAISDKCS